VADLQVHGTCLSAFTAIKPVRACAACMQALRAKLESMSSSSDDDDVLADAPLTAAQIQVY